MSLKFFNNGPYFDDYDETKNYVRVLFRPGKAVQARELTQLQTAIQNQINRFGASIYKEGTPVINGLASIDNRCDWVKYDTSLSFTAYIGKSITNVNGSGGVVARVLGFKEISGDTYLFIKYISGNSDGSETLFSIGDTLYNVEDLLTIAGSNNVAAVGIGTRFSVDEGIYFISGNFVHADASSIFDIDTDLNGELVFNVGDSVVTPNDDPTLTDNATGTPNFAAPGAHRYAITLELAFVAEREDEQVHLLTIEDGKAHIRARTEYSNLERVLAQRTYEESGNYTVKPFQIDVREHLNVDGNRGLHDDGDESKLAIGIEPAVAYVDGYRVELAEKKYINVDKPRDFSDDKNTFIPAPFGNYIEITAASNNFGAVLDLNDTSTFDITGPVTATCRVHAISYVGLDTLHVFRLYLYDIQVSSGTLGSAGSYEISRGSFSADVRNNFAIYETGSASLVYQLPYDAVKSLNYGGGSGSSSYTVLRAQAITATATSSITITLSGEILPSASPSDYIVISNSGAFVTVSAVGTGTNSRTLTLSSNVTNPVVIFPVQQNNKIPSAKTLVSVTAGALTYAAGKIDLPQSDIFEVSAIMDGVTDVTSRFSLDDGQRDTHYQNGVLNLKAGQAAPGSSVTVTYKYFTHSAGDYFCVDSYPVGVGVGQISYSEIPQYKNIRLSNTVDFRKKLSLSTTDNVQPNSIFNSEVSEYLGRIDKLVVTASSEFKIVEGIPASSPVEPETPANAMALYKIRLPAWTFSSTDVQIEYVDNKRYTMRDIGSLEKRINNLEYYTSLSLLENQTSAINIGDRFKNGILVDSFYTHAVGNVFSADYQCALDSQFGGLYPRTTTKNYKLKKKTGGSDVVNVTISSDGLVTLPYTEVSHVIQPFASGWMNVNPFNVFLWVGDIQLTPSSDEWQDVTRRPDVVINIDSANDAIQYITDATDILGTRWNSWETAWIGTSETSKIRTRGHARGGSGKASDIITTTTSTTQIRTGLKTELSFDTVQKSEGDRVVDTTIIPFIRSRKIYFKATNLKPCTNVNVFFDGEDVTPYCEQISSGTYVTKKAINWTKTDVELHTDEEYSVPATLLTGTDGSLYGSFIIPNNSALRFRTGQRLLRITDSSTNNKQEETTSGEAIYLASGTLNTVQETIISTRTAQFTTTQVTETQTLTSTDTRIRWWDPLAQSFIIGDISGGIFATSIDLYFKSKDASIPVSAYIVSCDNGIPTQKIVPFSKVTVTPDLVNLSDDGTEATRFTFSSPVHLSDGIEYAIVVMSNSDKYETFIAELGAVDLEDSGKRITQNPYAGVLFKSQNASTWTPDQTKDLKFQLNRAQFSAVTGTIKFNELCDLTASFSKYSLIAQTIDFSTTLTTWQFDSNGITQEIAPNVTYNVGERITLTDTAPTDSDNQIIITATLQSDNEYLSPVIDLDRLSILCIDHVINDDLTGETASGGNSLMRYITRSVTLINAANQLNIFSAMNRQPNTDIALYVKAGASVAELDSAAWVKVDPVKSIPVNSNQNEYSEVQYIYGDSGAELNNFTTFAVKIISLSSNKVDIPIVKDLRVIASFDA